MDSSSWISSTCPSDAVPGLRKHSRFNKLKLALTTPRFWTLGPNWPKGGEIDILEGVNEYTNNGMTLHTGPGCQIGSDTSQFAGSVTTPNCDVAAEDQGKNVGCSIKHPSKNSYGAGLNQNGGGVYATAWNADAISIYFFPRGSIPADVLGDSPDPSAWGKPAAKFAGACDIEEMFAEQKIIIDTTFCGDWAGADDVWEEGSCGKKAKTCNEYVRDNPEAFTEAYWEINALKVYQDDGKPPSTPEYPAAPPKSTAISVPVPVSSVQASQYPVIPSVSSQVVLPSSSKLASETPSKPTITPAVPLPSSQAPAPVVPTPSRTGRPQGSGRPSQPINTQIRPAPTGLGGMPGWSWPVAADNGGGDDAPVPSLPDTPAQNTTGVPVLPSSRIAIDLPSNVPVAPARPSDAPPAVPDGPPVHTIYHTVYITKTAEPVAATPGPDAAKARMARHIKDHRRRLTQHHARV